MCRRMDADCTVYSLMNVRRSVCVWWYVLCLDGMHFMSENVDYMQLMVMADGWKCFCFSTERITL